MEKACCEWKHERQCRDTRPKTRANAEALEICNLWLSDSVSFQEDADDVESRPDCTKQQTDPIQELSLLQFLKSKSYFLLLFPAWWGNWRSRTVKRGRCSPIFVLLTQRRETLENTLSFTPISSYLISSLFIPHLSARFSSCCTANDADPRLPAGNPGAG